MSRLSDVLRHIDNDQPAAIERWAAMLRVPSISTDPRYSDDCCVMAEQISDSLAALGFQSRVVATESHPIVLAQTEFRRPRRMLFYGHYDVQPVEPLELWHNPPFEPTREILDGREWLAARRAGRQGAGLHLPCRVGGQGERRQAGDRERGE